MKLKKTIHGLFTALIAFLFVFPASLCAGSLDSSFSVLTQNLTSKVASEGPIDFAETVELLQKPVGENESLVNYLQRAKESARRLIQHMQLGHEPSTPMKIHFVMGNEASDLDSMVSAIAYAYGKTQANQDPNTLYVPFINIFQEDFRLKRDAAGYVFPKLGIPEENLFFLDSSNITGLLREKGFDSLRGLGYEVQFTLMDQHELTPSQKHFWPGVVRIFDHREDSGKWQSHVPEDQVTIETVGSNSTLITYYLLEQHPDVITPEIARLLIHPIIKDTINFGDKKRTTGKDRKAADFLSSIASNIDYDEIFAAITKENFDITKLTVAELLRSDYKERDYDGWSVGISSISGGTMNGLAAKGEDEDFINGIHEFFNKLRERDLPVPDVLIGLNIVIRHGVPTRAMFIYSSNESFLRLFGTYLQAERNKDLRDNRGAYVLDDSGRRIPIGLEFLGQPIHTDTGQHDYPYFFPSDKRLLAYTTDPAISRKRMTNHHIVPFFRETSRDDFSISHLKTPHIGNSKLINKSA